MRRGYRLGLGSASALTLVLALGMGAARAQSSADAPADLGLPLPELPPLVILERDIALEQLPLPSLPEVVVKVESPAAREDSDKAMVTGSVAPAQQPASGLAAIEVQPAKAASQGVDDRPAALDIPAVEMPPIDPALTAPVPARAEPAPAQPEPLRSAIDGAPQATPDAVQQAQPAHELAAAIVARAERALALPRLNERERGEILAAYQANENRPFWIKDKGWSEAAKLLVAQLSRAPEDGLRARDYPLPAFEASDKDSLAEADVRLSALAVLYARDARGGRLEPRRLSRNLTPTLYLPSATEVLSELTAVTDPGAALAAYNPPHEGYRRLKAKLAELRQDIDDTPMVRIPAGPPLKVGMRDERVPLVRARLGLGPSDEPVFDRSTSLALADFQKQAGLRANGILSAQTLAALGNPASARGEQDIVAQMERWRWLPPDLGDAHIIVNVPEFQVRVMRDGKLAHQTRAIVGKPETATPIFSHKMDHLVVNPSWYVPPSILRKEFIPGLAADPDYAAKRGYIVTRGKNGSISVRQPPGERNALGWVKFMFPNDHAVYLHDTPNRRLFATERRAYSHGCVRVENPFMLADQVLGPEWTQERLKRLIGKGERRINLTTPMPIHLVYNTHVVDEHGKLKTFGDLYGYHRLVRQALDQQG